MIRKMTEYFRNSVSLKEDRFVSEFASIFDLDNLLRCYETSLNKLTSEELEKEMFKDLRNIELLSEEVIN